MVSIWKEPSPNISFWNFGSICRNSSNKGYEIRKENNKNLLDSKLEIYRIANQKHIKNRWETNKLYIMIFVTLNQQERVWKLYKKNKLDIKSKLEQKDKNETETNLHLKT